MNYIIKSFILVILVLAGCGAPTYYDGEKIRIKKGRFGNEYFLSSVSIELGKGMSKSERTKIMISAAEEYLNCKVVKDTIRDTGPYILADFTGECRKL